MKLKRKKLDARGTLPTTGEEVKNLLDMFEFYLVERSLGKPIHQLRDIVRDLRRIVGRLVTEHFFELHEEREPHFCSTLALLLSERGNALQLEDEEYIDYCIGEILVVFEYAQEIKAEFAHDPTMQRILAVDIPILQPFDFGTQRQLKLVKGRG